MENRKKAPHDVELPDGTPGSELRGEPMTGDALPGAGKKAPDARVPAGEDEGDAGGAPAPEPAEGEGPDVQEQPPRPPSKEDKGIRERPGQQAGS
ncbi:MAG TPA: hypothetical protein VL426_04535 [Candidatus Binatia bacterium]|jgi:hypothetical protein|nr:hypothetical protein [Candidatus Binatia bacterium]